MGVSRIHALFGSNPRRWRSLAGPRGHLVGCEHRGTYIYSRFAKAIA